MRIAVFSRAIAGHSTGGLAIAAWNICRALADAGHDVELFTTKLKDFEGDHRSYHVLCHYLAGTTPCQYEGGYYNRATEAFWINHSKNAFNAIVSISKAAMELLPQRPAPMLFTSHGIGIDAVQGGVNYAMVHNNQSRLDVEVVKGIRSTYIDSAPDIHCPEVDFYAKWTALGGVSLSACMDLSVRLYHPRVYFIPNPVYDVKPYPVTAKANDQLKVCLCAGDLKAANKGIESAVNLLRKVERPIQVHTIGKNSNLLPLYGIPVVHHGYVPHAKVLELLPTMDVLFDPSNHHSGLNMTVVQALMLGVPVIAFPFGGMPTAIRSGVNGFLINYKSHVELNTALDRVHADRVNLSRSAVDLANSMFSPGAAGLFYTRALENMVRGLPAPSALTGWLL